MLSKISLVAFLAPSALGLYLPHSPRSEVSYTWSVKNFTSVCTAATCFYSFAIEGPNGPAGEPSFDGKCSGRSIPSEYKPCGELGIDVPGDLKTKQIDLGRDTASIISVELSYHKDGVQWTVAGNSTMTHTTEPIGFEIKPTFKSGVPDKK